MLWSQDRGSALIVTLMATLLLTALGAALVLTTASETLISGNFRSAAEGLYAADASIERALSDLLTVADWDLVLSGSVRSGFVDGPPDGTRTLPDGSTLDLSAVVNRANCSKPTTCSDANMDARTAERPWGANNPRWRPYAYGPLAALPASDPIRSLFYVIVMVADDPSENDDDPLHDGAVAGNPGRGLLSLRAEAFGPRGAHKVVEATVARIEPRDLERGYVSQRGGDEGNSQSRAAGVAAPGGAVTVDIFPVSN
jgi:hypothetical protein